MQFMVNVFQGDMRVSIYAQNRHTVITDSDDPIADLKRNGITLTSLKACNAYFRGGVFDSGENAVLFISKGFKLRDFIKRKPDESFADLFYILEDEVPAEDVGIDEDDMIDALGEEDYKLMKKYLSKIDLQKALKGVQISPRKGIEHLKSLRY